MELFIKLGLKEIAEIIQTLGASHHISDYSGLIEVNGKQYHIMKEKNELIITTQDGRNMCIGINYEEKYIKGYQDKDMVFTKHQAEVDYYFNDGSSVNLKNQMELGRGYDGFRSVQRHNLMNGLGCKYYNQNGEPVASFNLGLEKICLNGSKKVYEFTKDGIVYGNKLVSLDGDKLLLLSGSEVPGIEAMETFDVDKEKEKIRAFADESVELHPFTKEALEDATRLLDRKDRKVQEVLKFYEEDLKELRKAIAIRNKIEFLTNEDVIRPEELEDVSRALREKLVPEKGYSK